MRQKMEKMSFYAKFISSKLQAHEFYAHSLRCSDFKRALEFSGNVQDRPDITHRGFVPYIGTQFIF